MKPTVGRIVIFSPPLIHVGEQPKVYPAIVVQVNSDETLELCTFGPDSVYHQHNVREHSAIAGGWSWPKRD